MTSGAWASTCTLRHTCATFSAWSIRNVERSMPMYLRL